ncbi:MAG: bifunctional pyr operon transcriptional regulator/uracil phosphoribosyltransferase PyrR [Bacteroidota bacterium]
MQRRLLLNQERLSITIARLCQQLIENHGDFSDSVILGMQPRGIYLAERITSNLKEQLGQEIPLGYLDTTFYRDDFRRRDAPLKPNETRVPFIIEHKKVILIDDVLYTGRSVRAALDAMIAFGRPQKVEFLVLIDRMYTREIPVEASYIGKKVNTNEDEKVLVELKEQDGDDSIWLVKREDLL